MGFPAQICKIFNDRIAGIPNNQNNCWPWDYGMALEVPADTGGLLVKSCPEVSDQGARTWHGVK